MKRDWKENEVLDYLRQELENLNEAILELWCSW